MAAPDIAKLYSFRNPPLEEVALAVQFQPSAVSYFHIAALHERLKGRFPTREEQQARPPMSEHLGPPSLRPAFEIEVVAAPVWPRIWLLSQNGSRLLQLQHDLFAFNWRRAPGGEEYPQYRQLRRTVVQCLGDLASLVQADDDHELVPNWCEVTYINHIAPIKAGGGLPNLDSILQRIAPARRGGFLPMPEDAQVALRFLIPGDSGPRGRLTVLANSAIRNEDHVPLWVITLTARLRVETPTVEGAIATLDEGRQWVVRAFAELTTDKMHKHWGLEDVGDEEKNVATRS